MKFLWGLRHNISCNGQSRKLILDLVVWRSVNRHETLEARSSMISAKQSWPFWVHWWVE